MIELIVVSDVRLYCECINKSLNLITGISVIGSASNTSEVINLFDINHIDSVLLDMRMPDSSSIMKLISEKYIGTKIIVIALPENDDKYLSCIECGITGYLSKDDTVEELVDAVKMVGKGSIYCPYDITQYILKCVRNIKSKNTINDIQITYPKLLNILTQREVQIIKLLAKGMSNKKISQSLCIELSTVKNHVHNILVKMGVESRTQAACFLQENNTLYKNEHLVLDSQ